METWIQSFGTEQLQPLIPNAANVKAPAVTP